MNSIGTAQHPAPSNEKENIPPEEPPVWALLAKDNLLTRDLGIDWVECVDLWFQIEGKLGYGVVSGTKVRPVDFSSVSIHVNDLTECPPSNPSPTRGVEQIHHEGSWGRS